MAKRAKQFVALIMIYLFMAIAFFFIGGDQIKYVRKGNELLPAKGAFPELSSGMTVEQSFVVSADTLDEISVLTGTYDRENTGTLKLSLRDEDAGAGARIARNSVPVEQLTDNALYTWVLEIPFENVKGHHFLFCIESACPSGSAPTVYYSELSRQGDPVRFRQEQKEVELTYQFVGKEYSFFGMYYWLFASGFGFLLLVFLWSEYRKEAKGKQTFFVSAEGLWSRYHFLIEQLVTRDFKTKYKRSVLGYLWSFLNPMLTMLVQYFIFSNLFKSDIENFPVYLLTGTIMFSFFQEAIGQGTISILANASLISKVYMPKYIFPVTKVLSCSITLFISVIPLLLMTVFTGEEITSAFLLLPFALFCLILFCTGMSMLLSTAMVFFRDTQYIWGLVSLIWMYATPLFYPESILPKKYQFVHQLNPMYHMVKFARTILIDGISPEPMRYFYCLFSAAAVCLLGALVFKKNQDKFILYI